MNSRNTSYKIFTALNYGFMLLVILVTLIPFLNIAALSTSSVSAIINSKVTFFPVGFNVDAYKVVLDDSNFFVAYKNTIVYTVLSALISIIFTIICAYPLSKKNLFGRKVFMSVVIFTMMFNGGLIPNYILIRSLGWVDHIWAIIIPGAISQWNLLVTVNFFQSLPDSLEEAAQIDGLNHMQIFMKIILPLSKPIIATIGLFYAVAMWNNWFGPMIYMNSGDKYPITLYLRNMIMGAEIAAKSGNAKDVIGAASNPTTIRSAAIMLVTLPILCVYPFVQKYFVKGVMIGAVKG